MGTVGWVLVSYFMIAGGFLVAAVLVGIIDTTTDWARQAVFFLGALIGGMYAGRASPHKAVAEPAIAGLLFVPTLVAVFTVGLGWRLHAGPASQGALAVALTMGLISGLGGLVGGLLGRRIASAPPGTSALSWWGISILIHLGATLVVAMLVTFLLVRSNGSDVAATGAIFLALAISSLLGGFIAQAAVPRRLIWTCGAGAFALAFLGIAVAAIRGELSGSTIFGGLMLGFLATLIGAIGALLGWRLIAQHHDAPATADLPEVRLHS